MQTIDVTAGQIRAARHMLRWSQVQLAKASGISRVTIANLEIGKLHPRVDTLRAIVGALERAGITLIGQPL